MPTKKTTTHMNMNCVHCGGAVYSKSSPRMCSACDKPFDGDVPRSPAASKTESTYPRLVKPYIIQYEEHVFVWFTPFGVGGAADTAEQAQSAFEREMLSEGKREDHRVEVAGLTNARQQLTMPKPFEVANLRVSEIRAEFERVCERSKLRIGLGKRFDRVLFSGAAPSGRARRRPELPDEIASTPAVAALGSATVFDMPRCVGDTFTTTLVAVPNNDNTRSKVYALVEVGELEITDESLRF